MGPFSLTAATLELILNSTAWDNSREQTWRQMQIYRWPRVTIQHSQWPVRRAYSNLPYGSWRHVDRTCAENQPCRRMQTSRLWTDWSPMNYADSCVVYQCCSEQQVGQSLRLLLWLLQLMGYQQWLHCCSQLVLRGLHPHPTSVQTNSIPVKVQSKKDLGLKLVLQPKGTITDGPRQGLET